MCTKILTVCQMPQGKKYAPGFNLKGDYLRKYGFEVGDMVRVEISQNQIIISKNNDTAVLQCMGMKNPALLRLIESLDLEQAA